MVASGGVRLDVIPVLRALAGALAMFVLPGLAWTLALRPGLHRDRVALLFWSVAASVALLVLYGTALGLAGRFTAPWLVGCALAVAAVGALVAGRRGAFRGPWARAPDPSAAGRARVATLRRLKVDATMLRKSGRRKDAEALEAEARDVEAKAREELYP